MKKTSIIKKCVVCINRFNAYQYLLKRGQARYCSIKCKAKEHKGRLQTSEEVICSMCKASFYVQPNQLKSGRGKYCSSLCYHESTKGKIAYNRGIPMSELQKVKVSQGRIGKMIGFTNHSWKGGVTPINKKVRDSIEIRLWREAVFARDSFTCQMCSQVGGKLNADHIKPFSLFPELRLAIDNGQVLCVPCHRVKTQKDLPIIRSMQKVFMNAINNK